MSLAVINKLFKSTTIRLSLVVMGLTSGSFFLLGAFFYWGTLQLLERDIRFQLERESEIAQEIYRNGGLQALTEYLETRQARDDRFEEYFFVLVDRACQPITAVTADLPSTFCRDVLEADGWYHFALALDDVYLLAQDLREDHRLLLGLFSVEVESARYLMREIASWALVAAIVLSLLMSIGMAIVTERRLEPINRISRAVRLGNLSNRIPRRYTNDEYDRLAANLNEMLDEIQQLMAGITHVSDSIAHDLRTPLTILRGELEDLLDDVEGIPLKDRVQRTLDQVDRLLAMFSALMRVAQIEAGSRRAGFTAFELLPLISEVVDFYEPLASEKAIRLESSAVGHQRVHGDRDLVFQAISNLVENAIAYSPLSSLIQIELAAGHETVRVSVSDNGPGIPAGERDKVLERFYRLDRRKDHGGAGLGLSLVAAVARLHNGQIILEDNQPGLRAILELSAV